MLVIDWFSLSVIFAFSVAGFFNGFAKEVFSTGAWILSIIGAWYFGPLLFPFVSPYLGNPEIKSVISFALLFLILFLLIKLSGMVFSKFLNALGLGFFDKTIGLIFGSLKGIAILVTAYILVSSSLESHLWWIDSFSKEWTIKIAEFLEPLLREWKAQADILFNKEHVTFPPSI